MTSDKFLEMTKVTNQRKTMTGKGEIQTVDGQCPWCHLWFEADCSPPLVTCKHKCQARNERVTHYIFPGFVLVGVAEYLKHESSQK
jgi:hypothetical protein